MSHKISLTTRDNQQFEFQCETQQDIQQAAEAASLYPPFGCKSGSCGACLGHCDSGDYELQSHSEEVLSISAKKDRDILLCRTLAKTDLQISVPYGISD